MFHTQYVLGLVISFQIPAHYTSKRVSVDCVFKAMIDPVNGVILVHGGAGDIPEWRVPLKLHGVRKAARAGYVSLSKDECSALDAVEAAVKVMEDDEAFNAGTNTAILYH